MRDALGKHDCLEDLWDAITEREEREYAAECEYDRRKDDALVERAENQMRDRKEQA